MARETVHRACDRARRLAALLPDGELSTLERRALSSHLRSCSSCRVFAEEVEGLACTLRDTPLEEPSRRLVPDSLGRRRARRSTRRIRETAVAGAAAAIGLAVGLGSTGLAQHSETSTAKSGSLVLLVDASEMGSSAFDTDGIRAEMRGPAPAIEAARRTGNIL